MTKKEAREYAKKIRTQLNKHELELLQKSIKEQFISLNLPEVNFVLSYMPLNLSGEVDPSDIIQIIQLRNPNLKVSIPRILSDLNMESVEYNEVSELKKNVYGISEPVDGNLIAIELLDMVLMPLLAFDLNGNRVGFGKGYYDRFLKSCRRDIVKIGLSFLDPLDKISDINSYDIPMDFCITPKMTYAFH